MYRNQQRQKTEATEPKTSERAPVDKSGAAKQFGRDQARTKAANLMAGAPMRGGIRL